MHLQDEEMQTLLLAHGAQPQPEEGFGALQDGTDDGARAALGVIAGGQRHGALEGFGHGGEVAAMREAIGVYGDGGTGKDAEQAEHRP